MNTLRFCLLLVALVTMATVRADDDVMKLYDEARRLSREVKKSQVVFLITKEPALNNFPIIYFDTTEVVRTSRPYGVRVSLEKGPATGSLEQLYFSHSEHAFRRREKRAGRASA